MERSAFNDEYPGAQFGLTLLFSFAGLIAFGLIAYLLAALFFGLNLFDMQDLANLSNPKNIEITKFMQIIVSTGLFIVTPLVLAKIFSGKSLGYLKVNHVPNGTRLIWVALIILTAIPFINLIAALNSQIKMPEFMSYIEKWMMDKEKANEGITEAFLKVTTLGGFAVNMLMIAIIPALGEEFFFRGILQRILINLTRNSHWGIIIAGFIFSAIHMQFYGFFPRWLLGIMFGYMFLWSGSLWLPILAHFINNSMAVVAYYLINAKMMDPKILDIGSTVNVLPLTVLCTILMGTGLYRLYKMRLINENG